MRTQFSVKAELGAGAVSAAYAAALVDGDGCIGIMRRKRRASWAYWLSVTVANTDPRITEWLHARYGGGVVTRQRGVTRPMFYWALTDSEAQSFLRIVLPYLVSKASQASLALGWPSARKGDPKITAPALRAQLWARSRELNAGAEIRSSVAGRPQRWTHLAVARP
jgi:hypothetical protein